jgi:uncharacterized protein YbaR (Trm112 family)
VSSPAAPAELLRRLYREGRNIMQFLREGRAGFGNDEAAILAAYDLQAGSYAAAMADPQVYARNLRTTGRLAAVLDRLGGDSLLHAGTGEAKTLTHVAAQLARRPSRCFGFDISLSRLLHGRRYARAEGQGDLNFFAAAMSAIPVAGNAFDVVFTSHSLEPNGGREAPLLAELYRACGQYLVLREPSWELGGEETRAHIERNGYVRGLPAALEAMGCDVVEHGLFGEDENPRNRAALTVVRKRAEHRERDAGEAPPWAAGHPYVSPIGRDPLHGTGEAYYSRRDCLAFPVLAGIPCLLAEHGVFSSQYLDFVAEPPAAAER